MKTMFARPEEMAEILKTMESKSKKPEENIDRQMYNPSMIEVFENYVENQVEHGFYDLEANLALLQLYQLNPADFNLYYVELILLKALMNLPHSDFVMCIALLEKKVPELDVISELGFVLESCSFQAFWARYHIPDVQSIIKRVSDFEDRIRDYICYTVELTFEVIEANLLKEMLDNPPDDVFEAIVNSKNWTFTEDRAMIYTCNHENIVKAKSSFEKLKFQDLIKVIEMP